MHVLISVLAVSLALPAMLQAQATAGPAIRGRIVDDIRHEPIGRVGITAQITLKTGERRRGVSVVSDAQGNFAIPISDQGHYFVIVGQPGYLGLQGELDIDGTAVDLGDLVMTIGRAISGTVRGVGDPTKVRIEALQVKAGKIVAAQDGGNSTYPRPNGEFSLGALLPGRYVLYARVLDLENPNPRPAAPVFFPGRTTPDITVPIDLRNTAQFTNAQIVVEDKPGISISGTVVPSTAYPAGTPMGLMLMVPDLDSVLPLFGAAVAATQTSVGERFGLTGVPPGTYAAWIIGQSPDGGIAAHRHGRIDVSSQPIADLRIQAPEAGARTSGKAEIDAADGTPATPVRLMGQMDLFGNVTRAPITNDDGDLTLPAAAPGERLVVSNLEPPRGTYVASVVQGRQDLSAGPYAIVPGGDPVRILLKKDGGKIEGKVNDGDRLSLQAFVVLAPKDKSAISRYSTVAVRLQDGSFRFDDVAPGDYDLFAFDRNEEDQYLDPTYLRRFAQRSVAISVSPRSAQVVQLQAIKTR